MYQIIDQEQDEAGKWRYRVAIGGETVMFKWDEPVDDATVQAEAARYVLMREQVNAPSDPE
jgi:hypothetical protein